ncbi:MAG: hypothetical protein WBF14_11335 [Candidatus Acidiferrales bacterium]
MKAILAMFGAALLCAAAAGQAAPVFSIEQNVASDNFAAQTLKKGAWEFGILAGGGTGLGKSDDTQFMLAGGRVGYVLTGDHLPGWLRGNFQWTVDLMPILTVFPPQGPIYGGGFKPVIWQWNFTSHKKFVPYFSADGGILFSARNVPPGDTSYVNFMPGASLGARLFTKRGHAIFFQISAVHISSASLGTHNPGYNGSLFFTAGYSWFKTRGN